MTDEPNLARWLHPELLAYIARSNSFSPDGADAASMAESRARYDRLCAGFRAPRPPGVVVSEAWPLRRYRPDVGAREAMLLYVHGGGFVLGGLESHDDVCAEFAAGARLEVVAVDYRLAPEHPYPAALDDVEQAWLVLAAERRPVVVGGDSAGGNLAAALCHRLRRRGEAQPRGQLLLYPALSADPLRVAGSRGAAAPLLTAEDCAEYGRLYAPGAARREAELAPLEAADFSCLAPAAIFAAGFDPLRQDAEDYAAALLAAGVPVRYRADPGLVHGWLRARHGARQAARAFAAAVQALADLADGVILN